MLPLFAKSRIFDYLEKKGLEKTTDVNAGDWHLYILKELIDNALDADEASGLASTLRITLKYQASGHLLIRVSNPAQFPVDDIPSIFALDTYVSVKDYFNNITRGQQGNGLKTVLGIPYALHHFSRGDYALSHRPMRIQVGGQAREVWYELDEETQAARVASSALEHASCVAGTSIELRVSAFRPAPGPSTAEVRDMARKYALFNPFAEFFWDIAIQGEAPDRWSYPRTARERHVDAVPPILWYRFDQFSRLFARIAQQSGAALADLLANFLFLDQPERQARVREELSRRMLPVDELAKIGHGQLKILYDVLNDHTPSASIERLGELGLNSVSRFVEQILAAQGTLCYRQHKAVHRENPADSPLPYVLEVFMVRSGTLAERTLWSGANYTPLYKDPFYRKHFTLDVGGQETKVRGIDRMLEALGIELDDNVLLGVHLISPSIEFQSFGKSEFDCAFLEVPLVAMLRELAAEFKEANRLEPNEAALAEQIGNAAEFVSMQGRYHFTVAQLFYRVCALARQKNPALERDIKKRTFRRFETILLPDHEAAHGELKGLIRTHKAKFVAPSKQFDKVLWILKRGFEDVFLRNDLMSALGVAVFWGDLDSKSEVSSLVLHLRASKCQTILLLHDADVAGCLAAQRIERQLGEKTGDTFRVCDLGLTPSMAVEMGLASDSSEPPNEDDVRELSALQNPVLNAQEVETLTIHKRRYDLNAMSIDELIHWFHDRYLELGILQDRRFGKQQVLKQLSGYLRSLVRARIRAQASALLGIEAAVECLVNDVMDRIGNPEELLLNSLAERSSRDLREKLERTARDLVDENLTSHDIRRQLASIRTN
jgi:hypothetical protein